MRQRWGPERARVLSRRLQQLEAMTSLADLAFMPFDSHEHADGVVEIVVDDRTSLFVRNMELDQEGTPMHAPLMIADVESRSTTAL